MSTNPLPINDAGEEELFAFGDAVVLGRPSPPREELEQTLLRVQRALRTSETATSPLPTALKTQIWKDVMQSTATMTRPSSAIPSGTRRPGRPTRSSSGSGAPPRLYHPRTVWTRAANVALALLIILAGAVTWRIAGDGSDATTIPGVAWQPSTPPSAEGTAVISSPPATQNALTTCNLSVDIPIITDLAEDEAPITTTSLYVVQDDRTGVNPRGVLKLGCEGEPGVVLAENVVSVWQGPWPGTVSVMTLPLGVNDLSAGKPAYVSMVNGATVELGAPEDEMRAWQTATDGSPWVIGPAADDPSSVVIADLRTMEARPFNEVAGVSAPSDAMVIVSQPANDGAVAVGFAHPHAMSASGGALMTDLDAPGDLLLLGSSFDDTSWISAPEALPGISAIALSPDGSHAAVTSFGEDEGGDAAASYRYGLISMADGTEVGASDRIPFMDNPFVVWIQGGSAVAYLAGSRLQTMSIDGSGQPETVFEVEDQLFGLQTTWDPNVVVAATLMDHGTDAEADQTAQDIVYSINVATGAVQEFAGRDASASVGWITDAGALVMYQWNESSLETLTYQVFDPVTAEQIGEIVDAPTVQVSPRTLPTLGPNSVAISVDGRVEVIALGTQHIYAFIAHADGLTMRRVASPDGLLSEMFLTANIVLSPDGTTLSLMGEEDESRTRYLTELNGSEAAWTVIPNTVVGERGQGLITFVKTDA